MEERGGHLATTGPQGDAKQLVSRAVSDRKQHCFGDLVDERDVLTVRRLIVVEATHTGALDVAAGIVAKQVVDGADTEYLVKRVRSFGADDVIQPVAQRHHGYSTPINSASPRCPVR
jgi:hypothetical protein